MTDTATTVQTDKPWHARAICCGKDDGTYDFATRGDAEVFRSQYTANTGQPGWHERAVIITGPADQAERDADAVLTEHLQAMRSDKGMQGMVDECLTLLGHVRAELAKHRAGRWELEDESFEVLIGDTIYSECSALGGVAHLVSRVRAEIEADELEGEIRTRRIMRYLRNED
jgi:hypothetical protein